ncbi:ATP phosphoribosyltransferase regulatory subunit [Polynucleobacter sp. IMCC 30228]|uniref:ATP phosphoribosyltransferase regulatory subunit n=1 Tax=Polynucleobacter sp. IMCC 30228 TaxID=2781011 RepID=UPI001F258B75|nr:ATP phosphoribosyltransferase regulatory subunit [Polynucleobacter sp. IMCC 30228]MCE7527156.1 ATP phosphoribosyltransferase regulatory subunit [Polynucleobacter sp. IMCC 30228]
MNRWLLPEDIADILPAEAAKVEALRRRLLDLYQSYGYELVTPPLIEFLDSLLTGTGADLNLQTFKLVDQLSGRTLGLRADMTPQVARIDAHLLNRDGVTRLCYAGSVVHARASITSASREEVQLGAEIYGCASLDADSEAISLLLQTLRLAGQEQVYLDLSHAGVLAGVLEGVTLTPADMQTVYGLLQSKDRPSLVAWSQAVPTDCAKALLALTHLNGPSSEVLKKARKGEFALPNNLQVQESLLQLEALLASMTELAPTTEMSIDLADLRGYQYHTGVTFAAYIADLAQPIARGGRYDQVGAAFGRARPATGFSLDLLTLASLSKASALRPAIRAPWLSDAALLAQISQLREAGEVVIQIKVGEEFLSSQFQCDRELVQQGKNWVVSPLRSVK